VPPASCISSISFLLDIVRKLRSEDALLQYISSGRASAAQEAGSLRTKRRLAPSLLRSTPLDLKLEALRSLVAATMSNAECQVSPLTGSQMVGLTFVSESSFLSLASDGFVLNLILLNFRRHKYRIRSLIQSPLDAYILSLIISDIFQGIGSALSVRWIHKQQVSCGGFCTAQGTLQTIGETTSGMATLVIAIHTFVVVAFRKDPKRMWIPAIVVSCIWLYVIVFVAILASHTGKDVWNYPTPYWCWVGHRHLAAQLAGEYLWLWLAAFASILLYVPLYFILNRIWCGGSADSSNFEEEVVIPDPTECKDCALCQTRQRAVSREGAGQRALRRLEEARARRGPTIAVNQYPITLNHQRFTESPLAASAPLPDPSSSLHIKDPEGSDDPETSLPPNLSLWILLYPIAYTFLILPLSIARWTSSFGATAVSNSGDARTTFVGSTIFNLSGFVNAFLIFYVRRGVSLLNPPLAEEEGEEKRLSEAQYPPASNSQWQEGNGRALEGMVSRGSYANSTHYSRSKYSLRTKSKSSIGDLEVRIRNVEVRGEVSLPD